MQHMSLKLGCWVRAMRPRTLSLAVVPVGAGSLLAWSTTGRLDGGILVATLLGALLIQIGTNLHNDVADFTRGADDEARVGPPRATAQGWFSPGQVRGAAVLSFGLAVGVGIYLAMVGGWPILVLGLAAIAAGWAYTGGPRPLGYLGLGEVFVFLFFGLAAVAGTYYLQTGALSGRVWVSGAVLGMPAAAVLVVNNYRDLDSDRRAGKRTLAVRWGRRVSRYEYGALLLAPLLLSPLWLPLPWAGLPLVLVPWALNLIARLRTESPGPACNALLGATAQYQLGLALLCGIALFLGGAAQ